MRSILWLILVMALPAIATEPAHQSPLMRDFMGINGHFTFKPELCIAPLANWSAIIIRRSGISATTHRLRLTFPLARNKVELGNDLYGSWKKEGFRIDACLQFESIKQPAWKNLEKDDFARLRRGLCENISVPSIA